jgi:hypothetical protein
MPGKGEKKLRCFEPSSLLCHAQLSPALLVLWARELFREEDMVLLVRRVVRGSVIRVLCCEALGPVVYVNVVWWCWWRWWLCRVPLYLFRQRVK